LPPLSFDETGGDVPRVPVGPSFDPKASVTIVSFVAPKIAHFSRYPNRANELLIPCPCALNDNLNRRTVSKVERRPQIFMRHQFHLAAKP
jgi:hypothetical protein